MVISLIRTCKLLRKSLGSRIQCLVKFRHVNDCGVGKVIGLPLGFISFVREDDAKDEEKKWKVIQV